MQIVNIRLEQFRNYEDTFVSVQPGVNVLYGDNAQGKTNILEAIYLCACARSHRTSRDPDMIRHNAGYYQVSIEYVNDNGVHDSLSIRYMETNAGSPGQGPIRMIHHNGIRIDRISDLMGLFHAVIFAPEDLMLVKEGPGTRRRFLDLLISQIRPSYFKDLQLYSRLLGQRNKLLKEIRQRTMQPAADDAMLLQLDVWTQTLSQAAARIIRQRFKIVQQISEHAADALFQISSGKEKLNVKYKTLSSLAFDMSINDITTAIEDRHKTILSEDIARGSTSCGPHRDDMELWLDGEPLKPYASQGQQRSVVLALKMAELKIIRNEIEEFPILLLDDVMSELDENRRGCLLAGIQDAQVFVTCTDAGHVVQEMELACRIRANQTVDQSKKSELDESNRVSKELADSIEEANERTESSKQVHTGRNYSFYHVRAGSVTAGEVAETG